MAVYIAIPKLLHWCQENLHLDYSWLQVNMLLGSLSGLFSLRWLDNIHKILTQDDKRVQYLCCYFHDLWRNLYVCRCFGYQSEDNSWHIFIKRWWKHFQNGRLQLQILNRDNKNTCCCFCCCNCCRCWCCCCCNSKISLKFDKYRCSVEAIILFLVRARVIFDHARQRFFSIKTADHLKKISRKFFLCVWF